MKIHNQNTKLSLRNEILFLKDSKDLTVSEIADRLDMSYRTIYRMMKDPEYKPQISLKGFIYLYNELGIDRLRDISKGVR